MMLGAWNTAIVNPKWLAKEILGLPEGTPFTVDLAIGSSTNVRALVRELFIMPTNDTFLINPSKEDENLFSLADKAALKLYSTLPHTPIVAIGYNFSYELEKDETFSFEPDFNLSRLERTYNDIKGKALPNSTIKHSLSLENYQYLSLNLSFQLSEEKVFLLMNYHYQADNNETVINEALGRFHEFYEHSKLVSRKLITTEVKH